MPSPDQQATIKILNDAAVIARRLNCESHSILFEKFHARFQSEKPTFKTLRGEVEPLRNDFAIKVRDTLEDCSRDARPGMEAVYEDYCVVSKALMNLIYPIEPQPPQMDISAFHGAGHVKDKLATYSGDPAAVKPIVERSIELIRQYSALIGKGDFAGAYALTDSGLRAWMTLARFIGDHERASQEYSGPALDFLIGRFTYVYADEQARKRSNSHSDGWPKGTAKPNRRAGASGFWIRDRAAQTGCAGTLWIAEEHGLYRIANFNFWRP